MSAATTPSAAAANRRASFLADALATIGAADGRWRRALLNQIAPRDHDVILDVGCGGGALLTDIARLAPRAIVMGLDPDSVQLARARARAEAAGVRVELIHGAGRDIASYVNELAPSKIVCARTLDALTLVEQRAILQAARAALRPGGEIHVAVGGPPGGVIGGLLQAALGGAAPTTGPRMTDLLRQAGFVAAHDAGAVPAGASVVYLHRARAP